jgi:hypothetical protein
VFDVAALHHKLGTRFRRHFPHALQRARRRALLLGA